MASSTSMVPECVVYRKIWKTMIISLSQRSRGYSWLSRAKKYVYIQLSSKPGVPNLMAMEQYGYYGFELNWILSRLQCLSIYLSHLQCLSICLSISPTVPIYLSVPVYLSLQYSCPRAIGSVILFMITESEKMTDPEQGLRRVSQVGRGSTQQERLLFAKINKAISANWKERQILSVINPFLISGSGIHPCRFIH